MEVRVGGKFILGRQIGCGSFGDIHIGTNIETNEEVAIKLESVQAKSPALMYEAKLYSYLGAMPGVPQVYWYGNEGTFNVMVLELLGPSLGDLFEYCDCSFTVRTVIMLAEQLITRIEHVHAKNFLHRDIKPENFVMGLGKLANTVYVIDFGLARKYRNPQTQEHIPLETGRSLIGTAEYSSLNTHNGLEQSRRDDLESIGFMLYHFLKGQLPWHDLQDLELERADKHARIKKQKKKIPIEELGKHHPSEFITYVNYCRSLDFEDRPDYPYARMLLKEVLYEKGYELDYPFDWDLRYENEKVENEARYGTKAEPTQVDELAMKIRDQKMIALETLERNKSPKTRTKYE